jgi:adenosylhomocysteine nucleosidase
VKARVAIVAALPREVAMLVQGWDAHNAGKQRGVHVWTSHEAVVVAAGMGESRATLAVQAALALGPVDEIVSTGLAGACDPSLRAGSVLEATEVVDVRTGERYATAGDGVRTVLVTGAAIANVREKARLFTAYGAAAVEMEAATVARLALANGIRFRAIKAISDDYDFELGSLGKFKTKHGHFHTRAFVLHTAVRPHHWAQTIRLGRHSKLALAALTGVLKATLHPNA